MISNEFREFYADHPDLAVAPPEAWEGSMILASWRLRKAFETLGKEILAVITELLTEVSDE